MTLLEHDLTSTPVCTIDRLTPDRGVAALIERTPVAVFLTSAGELHAVDNVDPISGASVLSRGLVGDAGGRTTVASPLYKQRFDLRTGECLDQAGVRIGVHHVVVEEGVVKVRLGT